MNKVNHNNLPINNYLNPLNKLYLNWNYSGYKVIALKLIVKLFINQCTF